MDLDQIYCNDCRSVMRNMPDKCIDLVLTDPPYGIGEAAGKNKSRISLAKPKDYGDLSWDNSRVPEETFKEIMRVSKNQIIFGGNYYVDYLSPTPCWIVWDKDRTGDFADCELAWTSFSTAVRKFKWRWNGMLQEDMGHKEIRTHPTQKPVPLFMQILERYSSPGKVIFDPFIGSGTTAIACLRTGRHFIGVEKHRPYYLEALERINKERAQVRLANPFDKGFA